MKKENKLKLWTILVFVLSCILIVVAAKLFSMTVGGLMSIGLSVSFGLIIGGIDCWILDCLEK